MTNLVAVVEFLALVVAGVVWWRRERKWRAVAGLRTGLAGEFTDRLCAEIQRKLGQRKGMKVINESMRTAREAWNTKVMGIAK
jgi:uncharacterized membrane protein